MEQSLDFLNPIWNQLDRFKDAVIKLKSIKELTSLENRLLQELQETPKYNNDEVSRYFHFQCAKFN